MEVLSTFHWGDLRVTYYRHLTTVGWQILPAGVTSWETGDLEPLMQVSIRGDAASGGFAAGHTLRGGASLDRLSFRDQRVEATGRLVTVTTAFDAGPTSFHHVAAWRPGDRLVQVRTEVEHHGPAPLVVEMLSSFTLGGLSTSVVHRLRSTWSNEGRVVSERVEDLQLEPSWSGHGVRVERFGQVGSLPVRKFFPFVAVEDTAKGLVWAAQIACPSSWQIELVRRGDGLGVSGGLADFEFGHWAKTLTEGDPFATPWAFVTVGQGAVDQVAQRLVDAYPHPEGAAHEIPAVFNEFCSSWGRPSEAQLQRQLNALKGRGLDYFVIDAGWYADPEAGWERAHGDWQVAAHLFPHGLHEAAASIRWAGLKPGLWFELETCGPRSKAYQQEAHLLKRHGSTITSGERRFWDMADPWVVNYLAETVIGRLKADGFDYLKVDYNESLGVGCDGAESLGEGLRQRLVATQGFFRQLRRELPGLVIENCASGGHRLEASMMALTDFSSFSDAHECLEIPVLAANLHRVIPPRQSQIWAVLRSTDPPRRLAYSLAATFLGVPCLSGDVEAWDDSQWELVEAALRFHRRVAPLLCDGTTHYHGPRQASYRDLHGWQGVVRVGRDDQRALVVLHTFAGETPSVAIPLPWAATVVDAFGAPLGHLSTGNEGLVVKALGEFGAVGVLLARGQRAAGPVDWR